MTTLSIGFDPVLGGDFFTGAVRSLAIGAFQPLEPVSTSPLVMEKFDQFLSIHLH